MNYLQLLKVKYQTNTLHYNKVLNIKKVTKYNLSHFYFLILSYRVNIATIFAIIIPITPKSASLNVVPVYPKLLSDGNNNAGKNVIKRPFANAPNIAPLLPPVALPNTPAVAPQKKCGTTPGKITGAFNAININIPTIPPTKLDKNPIKTAFGA